MAVKRGPDGVPIDVPSVMHEKSKQSSPASDAPTSLFDSTGDLGNDKPTELNPNPSSSLFADEPPTVKAYHSSSSTQNQTTRPEIDETSTVISGGYVRASHHNDVDNQHTTIDARPVSEHTW